MQFETEAGGKREVADFAEVETGLANLDSKKNSFAILSMGDEIYMQTVLHPDGYVVERREGNAESHFSAMRDGSELTVEPERFTHAEMVEMFRCWASGEVLPEGVRWEPIGMAQPGDARGLNRFAYVMAAILFFIVMTLLAVGWR